MFFKTFERVENSNLVIMPLPAPSGQRLVLRWRGLELKASDIKPLSQMLESKSATETEQTLAQVGVPGWNIVFADQEGKIGYRAIGRAFARSRETQPGIASRSWESIQNLPTLRADEMPHSFNPARGYIVTANHRHWPENHSFYGGRAYTPGFRGHRIEELLTQRSKLALTDHQTIQCDTQANDAVYFVPALLDTVKKSAPAWVSETLSSWNFQTGLDCKACSFYRTWIDRLIQDELSLNEAVTYRLLKHGLAADQTERALRSTLAKFSESKALTPWSDFHRAFFPPLVPGSEKTDFLSTPGDKHTVNLGDGEWKDQRYNHKMGPSQRLIVELSTPPRIHLSFPGTPQEHDPRGLNDPGSPWQKWRECQYDSIEFPSHFDGKKLNSI